MIKEITYFDLKHLYKQTLKKDKNPTIYRLTTYSEENEKLQCTLTTVFPGKIGKEYYMTRGHKHIDQTHKEYYYCISGHGYLIVDNEKVKLKRHHPYVILGSAAHRLVNTGFTKLKVLTFYDRDAGHDYSVSENMLKIEKKI